MPRRPLKPCAVRTCAGRARNGSYCPDHAHLAKQKRKPDTRPSAARRGYDRNWRRIRGRYLKAHPDCVVCGESATEVDHIVSLVDGGTHRFSNLQAMCKTHHSQKTVIFDGGLGNQPGGGI